MENGHYGVGVTDVGVLAGLRGVGGYGYGYANQGNFLGDGSAVKEAVRGNRDIDLLEAVNRTNSDQFLSDRVTDSNRSLSAQINMGNEFLTDRIASQGLDFKFQNISDQLASSERLAIANQAALERAMNANQAAVVAQLHAIDLKQTECCCELKAGQAAILANQEAARLADAQNENNILRTQILIDQSSPRGNSGN